MRIPAVSSTTFRTQQLNNSQPLKPQVQALTFGEWVTYTMNKEMIDIANKRHITGKVGDIAEYALQNGDYNELTGIMGVKTTQLVKEAIEGVPDKKLWDVITKLLKNAKIA